MIFNKISIIDIISYLQIVLVCIILIKKSKKHKIWYFLILIPIINNILLFVLIFTDWQFLNEINNNSNAEKTNSKDNNNEKIFKVDDGVICKNCNTFNDTESIICIKCFKPLK